MKQQIEIDVPDGYEVKLIEVRPFVTGGHGCNLTVAFLKKQPEFIEVREYLMCTVDGRVIWGRVVKGVLTPENVEGWSHFIKWLDPDWRKVEV